MPAHVLGQVLVDLARRAVQANATFGIDERLGRRNGRTSATSESAWTITSAATSRQAASFDELLEEPPRIGLPRCRKTFERSPTRRASSRQTRFGSTSSVATMRRRPDSSSRNNGRSARSTMIKCSDGRVREGCRCSRQARARSGLGRARSSPSRMPRSAPTLCAAYRPAGVLALTHVSRSATGARRPGGRLTSEWLARRSTSPDQRNHVGRNPPAPAARGSELETLGWPRGAGVAHLRFPAERVSLVSARR